MTIVARRCRPEDADWIREHGGDSVEVQLIDLLCIVARLEQVSCEPDFKTGSITHERVFTCDLPRLRGYLPERALEEL